MANTLSDLNNILFSQLGRLADPNLTDEQHCEGIGQDHPDRGAGFQDNAASGQLRVQFQRQEGACNA